MKKDLEYLLETAKEKVIRSVALVEASLKRCPPFRVSKLDKPEKMEPYDALVSRFVRAVEVSIKFFRSYERYQFGEVSDTLRDLLHKMEKASFVTRTSLWIEMREVRNEIVHDYLPEVVKHFYDLLQKKLSKELIKLKRILTSEKLSKK